MLLEDATFPIVRLHYNQTGPDGEAAGFALFEALLARAQPFVLLGLGAAGAQQQTQEERKQVTLWMKRHREPLHAFVRAMVYVEPHAGKRLAARASATVFGKFWGYPMLVAASEAEGLVMAERLLAGESAASIDPDHADA